MTKKSEDGFSLIELLTVVALIAILVTLGAAAIRNYWFVRSLEGGKDGMITILRGVQQRVASASNPLVYGARFTAGSSVWQLIEYDRDNPSVGCTNIQVGELEPRQQFDAGIRVTQASFTDYVDDGTNISTVCGATGPTDIVWFFARGSATAGNVTVAQPNLNRSETVCVAGLTGRVTERQGSSC